MPDSILKDTIPSSNLYKLEYDFNIDDHLLIAKYNNYKTNIIGDWEYKIYMHFPSPKPPYWKGFLQNEVDINVIPESVYSSLVIIFTHNKEKVKYALCCGFGYTDIKDYAEAEFGIEIACKLLSETDLANITQTKPTGPVQNVARSFRNGFLPKSDEISKTSVLRQVKGKLNRKNSLGLSIDGKSSLIINRQRNFNEIFDLLNEIIKIDIKQTKFKLQVPGLKRVSKYISEQLDDYFIDQLDKGDFSNCYISIPDELYEKNCIKLVIGRDRKEFALDDEQEDIFQECVNRKPKNPSKVRVVGVNIDGREVQKSIEIIKLLEAEIDYNGGKYFRVNRAWYLIDDQYEEDVDESFNKIVMNKNCNLAKWRCDEEDEYLDECLKINNQLTLAHRKTIRKIEFADLINRSADQIIHVKKGRGAFLRNLFAQGYVAGKLFASDKKFQKGVESKFKLKFAEGQYTIIYAIYNNDSSQNTFTLFAKADLNERVRALQELGFQVEVYIIN
jgi:uncharacterized protein (TIGR04141 family)